LGCAETEGALGESSKRTAIAKETGVWRDIGVSVKGILPLGSRPGEAKNPGSGFHCSLGSSRRGGSFDPSPSTLRCRTLAGRKNLEFADFLSFLPSGVGAEVLPQQERESARQRQARQEYVRSASYQQIESGVWPGVEIISTLRSPKSTLSPSRMYLVMVQGFVR
jgi:hypothetical protein